jgi:chromosomal replication initiation ATPase DnaA
MNPPEIVGAENIVVPPTIDKILDEVSKYFNISIENIIRCSRRIKNPARRSAIFLCREIGGYALQDIATRMGNVSYRTISITIFRAKRDKCLQKDIGILEKSLRESLEFSIFA